MKVSALWIDDLSFAKSFCKNAAAFDSYVVRESSELNILSWNNPQTKAGGKCVVGHVNTMVTPCIVMVHRSKENKYEEKSKDNDGKLVLDWSKCTIFVYSTEGRPSPSEKLKDMGPIDIVRPIGELTEKDFEELARYANGETSLFPSCCRSLRRDFTIAAAVAIRGGLLLFKEPTWKVDAREGTNKQLGREGEQVWANAQAWIFGALDVADCTQLQKELKSDGHSEKLGNDLASEAIKAFDATCAKDFGARLKTFLDALENALQ